jgi:hypothetical protein
MPYEFHERHLISKKKGGKRDEPEGIFNSWLVGAGNYYISSITPKIKSTWI